MYQERLEIQKLLNVQFIQYVLAKFPKRNVIEVSLVARIRSSNGKAMHLDGKVINLKT